MSKRKTIFIDYKKPIIQICVI